MASKSSSGLDQAGWVVVDPSGQPYAWYDLYLAGDEDSAWRRFESDDGLRAQLAGSGWMVRPGSGVELVAGRTDRVQVSA